MAAEDRKVAAKLSRAAVCGYACTYCNWSPLCDKSKKLYRCTRCKLSGYCSTAHQKLDYRSHKPLCLAYSKLRDETLASSSSSSSSSSSNEEGGKCIGRDISRLQSVLGRQLTPFEQRVIIAFRCAVCLQTCFSQLTGCESCFAVFWCDSHKQEGLSRHKATCSTHSFALYCDWIQSEQVNITRNNPSELPWQFPLPPFLPRPPSSSPSSLTYSQPRIPTNWEEYDALFSSSPYGDKYQSSECVALRRLEASILTSKAKGKATAEGKDGGKDGGEGESAGEGAGTGARGSEVERAVHRTTYSFALTALAAITRFVPQAIAGGPDCTVDVSVHIVGADSEELCLISTFEAILHVLPRIRVLTLTLVGPDLPENVEPREVELCEDCVSHSQTVQTSSNNKSNSSANSSGKGGGKVLMVACRKKPYHSIAKSRKCDLALLFHPGLSEVDSSSWIPTIEKLLASKAVVCTAYTHQESLADFAAIRKIAASTQHEFDKYAEPPRENAWRGFTPTREPAVPDATDDTFFFKNYYTFAFMNKSTN